MSIKYLKVETCKALPAENRSRIKHRVRFSCRRVKGNALLFLRKRDIKRIHPPRLRSVYPAAIWQWKNRVCTAPSFPRLGHRSAHPTHFILSTPYIRPDVGECSISAEFGPKTTHHTEPSSAGRVKSIKTPRKSSSALTVSHTVCLLKHQHVYGPNTPGNH